MTVMIDVSAMAYSDQVILQHVFRLIEQYGTEATISHATISEASGAPYITVRRAMKRLMKNGKLVGAFTPQVGYSYRLPDVTANPERS